MNQIRKDIKHNFLSQIIFRIDYEGLLEKDVENCVMQMRDMFYESGLKNMETRTENKVDVQIKTDLNIPDENMLSISNNNTSIVYIFTSDEDEIIELGKSFFTLTINIGKDYKSFDKYIELLTESVYALKQTSKYFKALRMGLRKINICFLKNINEISKYFTKAAFNIEDICGGYKEYTCPASNEVTILTGKGFQVNYVRNIQEGVMQIDGKDQQNAYQIALDIDVFKESNREILPLLDTEESIRKLLIDQNTVEFEIFLKSLSEYFIEKLKEEKIDDENIIGVN